MVELANGSRQVINSLVQDLEFSLGSGSSKVSLHELNLGQFDVILGMDWLSRS